MPEMPEVIGSTPVDPLRSPVDVKPISLARRIAELEARISGLEGRFNGFDALLTMCMRRLDKRGKKGKK